MTWRRMSQNTTSYAITDKKIQNMERYGGNPGKFRQFRFLKGEFKIPALLVLFGNKCALISIKNDKPTIVLIDDLYMADIIKFLFMSLWNTLEA